MNSTLMTDVRETYLNMLALKQRAIRSKALAPKLKNKSWTEYYDAVKEFETMIGIESNKEEEKQ